MSTFLVWPIRMLSPVVLSSRLSFIWNFHRSCWRSESYLTVSVSFMGVAGNAATDACGLLKHLPPYAISTYIRRCISRLDTCRFMTTPAGHSITIKVGSTEQKMAWTGCRWRWKLWGRWRGMDDPTHCGFMDMPFFFCFEEVNYEEHVGDVFMQLISDRSVMLHPSLDLWCDSRDFDTICLRLIVSAGDGTSYLRFVWGSTPAFFGSALSPGTA